MTSEVRDRIVELVAEAEALIPDHRHPDLPVGVHSKSPEWHSFEHRIWGIGELIRQELLKKKSLRKDEELQRAFARVGCNPFARRGRQSFVMLLEYKCCAGQAPGIADQLGDQDVAGHAVSTLLKMQAPGYAREIEPFVTAAKAAWVRKTARRYVERYGRSGPPERT